MERLSLEMKPNIVMLLSHLIRQSRQSRVSPSRLRRIILLEMLNQEMSYNINSSSKKKRSGSSRSMRSSNSSGKKNKISWITMNKIVKTMMKKKRTMTMKKIMMKTILIVESINKEVHVLKNTQAQEVKRIITDSIIGEEGMITMMMMKIIAMRRN